MQPWCTPFLIWSQSVVPCPVLTVASWPAYRFSRGRSGSLVFPSLSEFSTVYCDQFLEISAPSPNLLVFSVAKSCPTLRLPGWQHTRLPYLSPTPRAFSNSCPLSQWYHPTISSSVIPFSSCLQSFPTWGSFPMSRLFSSGHSIGASTSASILPVNIQSWFPLRLTDLIFLLCKKLSRLFSSTTVQRHQFFSTQPSLWSNSHICTWLLEKTIVLTIWTFVGKVVSGF